MTDTLAGLKAAYRTTEELRSLPPRGLAQHDVAITRARLEHAWATGEGYSVDALEKWLADAEHRLAEMEDSLPELPTGKDGGGSR